MRKYTFLYIIIVFTLLGGNCSEKHVRSEDPFSIALRPYVDWLGPFDWVGFEPGRVIKVGWRNLNIVVAFRANLLCTEWRPVAMYVGGRPR